MEPKKYGLIKLNSKKDDKVTKPLAKASAIFDESDSDGAGEDAGIVPVRAAIKRQDQIQISQAIEEDPNVYEYDEVYDQMKGNDKKGDAKKGQNKPKYINNMIKTAEKRSKEQELVAERKIQKEREREGDLYKDKETFVTSAYRNKLEEIKKAQLEAERQEKIEAMMDVTKQSDLSGFYRGLYKRNTEKSTETEALDSAMELPGTSQNSEPETISFNKKSQQSQKRQIRERASGNNPADDEEDEPTVIKRSREPEPDPKVTNPETEKDPEADLSQKVISKGNEDKENKERLKEENKETSQKVEVQAEPEVKVKKPDRMTVIRELFQKRTVGEAFDEAQRRYFERKALRSS